MRYFTLIFLVAITFYGCTNKRQANTANTINPVIGDISYEKKYGTKPGATTDEKTRIQTHFEYVEQLLRSKDISNMPADKRISRMAIINLLHEYSAAAKFPANYDYPGERKPCFIDRNGNICAVGYLVAQTAGRALAEKINNQHQYDEIADMKTPELLAWVENSGLTAEECAMIQPTYGNPVYVTDNYVSNTNIIGTSVWSGLNASLNVYSVIQIAKNQPSKKISFLGMLSGAGQIAYGVLTLPEDNTSWGTTWTNNSQKNVSFINIGVGTATLFLNGINYFMKRRDTKNSYGVYSFPTPDNQAGVAFTFTRKL